MGTHLRLPSGDTASAPAVDLTSLRLPIPDLLLPTDFHLCDNRPKLVQIRLEFLTKLQAAKLGYSSLCGQAASMYLS
jgi:hypothetical protein